MKSPPRDVQDKGKKTYIKMSKHTKKIIAIWALIILGAAVCITMGTLSKDKENSGEFIGRSEIQVKDSVMTPEVMLSLGRLSDPQVSPDGGRLLYGVSYTSIEQNRSCRNLYISNLDGSNPVLATRSGQSISNARWSADGRKVAFLMGGQIYSAKVTRKGTLGKFHKMSDVQGGISEFKFSPDQNQLIYITSVPGRVKTPGQIYSDLPKAEAFETQTLMYRHWDHWTEEIPHSFVATFDWKKGLGNSFDILGSEGAEDGGVSPYELPTEPFSGLEELDWNPDGVRIAYSCRKKEGKEYAFSTDTEIYIYNVQSGECVRIPMDGGYDTTPSWSPDGKRLCWISMERDGYEADKQRLMMAEVDGMKVVSVKELSANFKYNVASPAWDADSEHIWFNALAEGLQAIWCADLEGNITRKTADDKWYDFDTPFHITRDGGKETLYTTWQSMDFPTEVVAIEPENQTYTKVTDENGHIFSQLREHRTEARQIKTVDGKDMLTWVLFPPEFDPAKTYPAIEICLGGPQGTLSQSWSYRWNYRLMCEMGYVVILPNRRGTTAFGQEWCEQISGDYCGLNIQDYLVAAREMKKEPYVGKMAACGASYGGYSVYYLCGVHGNTYDAFIAHAGIFNQEQMYMETEEMWFPTWDNGGAPWDENPTAKRHYSNSPHKLIRNWHTPLLVIHGGSDFRVPYDQGMAAYNCAQMMGVPSELIVFPNENHWILKPQNALFWHRSYFDWLSKWL